MLFPIGYREVVATSVVLRCRGFRTEVTGASVGMKEPAFKDGYASMAVNATITIVFVDSKSRIPNHESRTRAN